MFQFNDKLYFWFLKPTAQVYSAAVPQDFRDAFNNFFRNLATPVRFVNSLLQLKFKEAGNEIVRLVVNSTIGVGGLGDPAKTELGISHYDADTGQTLGAYGIDSGFYVVWPFFGPSSLRDTFGLAGDRFLTPLAWIGAGDISFGASVGIAGFDMVNKTSLRIGDYETFKDAAIDPYESMRDAYVQNRKKHVEEGRTGLERAREVSAEKAETGDK
jgi:phospholipid-binding lipoprotein MlaA